jgi:hypothetical protein
MRRRHTRDDYLHLLDQARRRVPGIALSTDVIVGFPGETDADFEDSLTLTRAAAVPSMSPSSTRRGRIRCAEADARRRPEAEKTARIVALQRCSGTSRQASTSLRWHRGRWYWWTPSAAGTATTVGAVDGQHCSELPTTVRYFLRRTRRVDRPDGPGACRVSRSP